MIRLLLRTTFSDTHTNASGTEYHSHEIHDPELERKLTSGGYGEGGHNRTELIGAEIITENGNEEWVKAITEEAYARGISSLKINL